MFFVMPVTRSSLTWDNVFCHHCHKVITHLGWCSLSWLSRAHHSPRMMFFVITVMKSSLTWSYVLCYNRHVDVTHLGWCSLSWPSRSRHDQGGCVRGRSQWSGRSRGWDFPSYSGAWGYRWRVSASPPLPGLPGMRTYGKWNGNGDDDEKFYLFWENTLTPKRVI